MNIPNWAREAVFYHIYPLGMCGAPWRNDFQSEPIPRLDSIQDWIPHLKALGVTALYMGPLWESGSHGYDTFSYVQPDRRLGSFATLQNLIRALHQAGFKIVLDAVFNHVGREFFAFRSLRQQGKDSPYCDWFEGLRFDRRSPQGDPFSYEGWKGHYDLVKLNLASQEVQQHIFEALRQWIEIYDIDGLRLDAADCMDIEFLTALKAFGQKLRPDFWMMGEVVVGDYSAWGLDSITNYELYDALHKSHNTRDYTRLAHTLERQFGAQGQYRDWPLYNFVDNHDVNRIASLLRRGQHLYPTYLLLFTLPGIPSLYYGSEAGIEGKRLRWSDRPLRPFIPHPDQLRETRHPDLLKSIRKLIALRQQHPALIHGSYRTLDVNENVLVFERLYKKQRVVVAVNLSKEKQEIALSEPLKGPWQDVLNDQKLENARSLLLYSNWGGVYLAQ